MASKACNGLSQECTQLDILQPDVWMHAITTTIFLTHLGEDFIIHHISFDIGLPKREAAVGPSNVCCKKHVFLLLRIHSLCEQQ